ncbi:MAG: DUF4143 domain-containing protein [Micrococcales bacterium]|nr:DUF4143 domain-containing protein [Micrococcales bacterium]MCL2666131.1 DUF4143 domain-containing protein [Micrococcales bacterium]
MEYAPRLVDAQLEAALRRAGAVVLEGPKACGKTTTGQRLAASAIRLDVRPDLRRAAQTDPATAIEGTTPRLIDEWQLVPDLWNTVRAAVDERQADGQFILAGSATPKEDLTRHSGAMRFAFVRMQPMSLAESGHSTSTVSLSALWAGKPVNSACDAASIGELAQIVCAGGWPSNQRRPLADAMAANHDYLRTVGGADIVTVDGVRHDPRRVAALLFAYARASATYVTSRSLEADTALYGQPVTTKTVSAYTDALVRLWTVVEQPAWGGHLRSRAQVRKSPKWHLADPSLAAAALGATPQALTDDPEAFGQLFESLVFRDLTAYAQVNETEVRAFSEGDNEIDAVLVHGVQWAGVEAKLSPHPTVIDAAAAKLVRISARMSRPPRFLAIVTGTGASYTRPDNVHVISIRHLGP